MNTTSESLLLRLRTAGTQGIDQSAWQQFVSIYTPLIFHWARKIGLAENDAGDLVQEVLTLAFQKLPEFRYDATRSFRGWLKTVTVNRYRELIRRKSAQQAVASHSVLEQLQPVSNAESTWDLDYARLLVREAMQPMKSHFQPATWEALSLVVGGGMPVETAAEQTGVSPWTIYSAKSRLMKRLREQLDGLL